VLRGEREQYPLLIGATAVRTRATLTFLNPADPEQVVGRVAAAGPEEVDQAGRLAAEAQPRWAATPARERVACLERAAQLIRERRHELAAWTVFEAGKTWREADVEIVEAIEYLDYYGRLMRDLDGGRALLQLPGERNSYRYAPRGIAAVIAPWNFPAALLTGMASAALVTGHAVILKPAEQSPIIGAFIARLLREAGIPEPIVQYLPGVGEEVGAAASVDLALLHNRLQRKWLRAFIEEPSSIYPGTPMPALTKDVKLDDIVDLLINFDKMRIAKVRLGRAKEILEALRSTEGDIDRLVPIALGRLAKDGSSLAEIASNVVAVPKSTTIIGA
jgi:hypothetical protein